MKALEQALSEAAQALWDFACGALWSVLALSVLYYYMTH